MKYRKSIFVVAYARKGEEIFYLILKRKLHWKGWEFPKGGIEKFEFGKRAIKREIREETGLEAKKIKKYKFKGKFKYKKELKDRPGIIGQSYSLYSCEVPKKKVKLDKLEHSDYKWVDFKTAFKKLTWPNQRKSLKIVNEVLNF